MDDDSGIVDIIIDEHSIDDETFNKGNIIANFQEYLSLNAMGMSSFISFEDKNNTGREFFITASIFSSKLDAILDVFNERIMNSPRFY